MVAGRKCTVGGVCTGITVSGRRSQPDWLYAESRGGCGLDVTFNHGGGVECTATEKNKSLGTYAAIVRYTKKYEAYAYI